LERQLYKNIVSYDKCAMLTSKINSWLRYIMCAYYYLIVPFIDLCIFVIIKESNIYLRVLCLVLGHNYYQFICRELHAFTDNPFRSLFLSIAQHMYRHKTIPKMCWVWGWDSNYWRSLNACPDQWLVSIVTICFRTLTMSSTYSVLIVSRISYYCMIWLNSYANIITE
jgi:hypothetical protein